MYLIKNAGRNIFRNKGKSILTGIIITVITICTCIGLSIHKAATNLVNTYIEKNPLEVSINLDMSKLREASDDDKTSFESLTIDSIKKYAESDLVKDYYYTLEASVNGSNIEAVEDNNKPTNENDDSDNKKDDDKGEQRGGGMSIGDFRITAYSNFAYLSDFTSGDKKITDGKMISSDSTDKEIVISKDLADQNNLSVGSEVVLALANDENTTFTYTVVGIFEINNDDSSNNFMGMNALNSSNQIYTNLTCLTEINDANGTNSDDTKLVRNDGLTVKYYLNDNDDVEKFEKEAKEKGLSDYYTVSTNEDEILATLKPIRNLSSFSVNFLIIILIVGIVVLAVINFLNIRDRKYEIGVLRAIGMSKLKVTLQLVLESFIVAVASLIIGTTVGSIISQPVTNQMLSSEISSYEEEVNNTKENFGGGGFDRPSQNMHGPGDNNQNISYVDSLKVNTDLITILELFGISILLTSTSALVASVVINKYSPNKILQNRV